MSTAPNPRTPARKAPARKAGAGKRAADRKAPQAKKAGVRSKRRPAARRRPRLRVVEAPKRRSAVFFALSFLLVGVMVTGIVSLQAMVSQTSFRMGKLTKQAATLNAQYGQLKLSVAELSAPERIAHEARRMGLVLPQQVEIVTVPAPLRRGAPGPNTGVPSFALKGLIGDEP